MNARPTITGAMPIILTERQEQFVQQILAGKSQTEAHQIAYGSSATVGAAHGSRLVRSVKIAARIEQLRADYAAAAQITVPYLTRELIATAKEARAVAQYAAASGAYGLVAKMHGLLIDKAQVEHVIRKPSAEPQSPDEMTADAWFRAHGLQIEGDVSRETLQDAEPATYAHTATDGHTDPLLTDTDSVESSKGL